MNVIEKILAKASGNKEVRPGDVVVANVDLMVMHDLSSNFVMKVFENEMENATIKDPSRITFAFDHNFAPATQQAAEALAAMRQRIDDVLGLPPGTAYRATDTRARVMAGTQERELG